MEIVKWRASYTVGVEEIDTQHKVAIELINKLYTMIRAEKSDIVIDEILDEMAKYADQHFQDEERLLEESNFPDLIEHKKQHQLYKDKLNILTAKEETAITDTYTFLRQWWTDHIMNDDKQYSDFLAQQKGL